jgi:hypothetical protein
MSQSMNGMSFYGNGISETDNIICNNLACNNISSNGILTNTLTAQQISTTALSATNLTGTSATFSDSVSVGIGEIRIYNGDIIAGNGNITASRHLAGELLNLQEEILTKDIVKNLKGLDKNVETELNLIRKNCNNLGTNNLILGTNGARIATSSSSNNVGIGSDTLYHNIDGRNNIAIGQYSLENVNGNHCIGIGYKASQNVGNINTCEKSVAIGFGAKFYDSNEIVLGTENETTFIPGELICSKDIHCQNLFLDTGTSTGGFSITSDLLSLFQGLTSNVQDTFDKIAKDCGNSITTGLNNYAFGNYTLPSLKNGSDNIAIGREIGESLISGSENIFFGLYSGQNVRGSYNICIGSLASQDSNDSYRTLILNNSIAIGRGAAFYDSNQIILGSSLHETIIQGTMNVIQTAEFKEPIICNSPPTLLNHLVNRGFVQTYMNSIASGFTPISLFTSLQTAVSFLTPISSFTALQTVVSSLSASLAKNKNGIFIPNTNARQTVVFSTPFPAGSIVTLITSLEFTNGLIGVIQVSSITASSFKYDIFNSVNQHIEAYVSVHWLAMIQ